MEYSPLVPVGVRAPQAENHVLDREAAVGALGASEATAEGENPG